MKDKINSIKIVLSIAISICIFVSTFNHGIIQYYGYIKFCLNKDDYYVVEGKIEDIQNITWDYRKTAILEMKKALVSYKINDEQYEQYTMQYPEKNQGEIIVIAVKISNHKVDRCVKYYFTKQDKILYFNLLVMVIIIYLFLLFISILEKRYKKKHNEQLEKYICEEKIKQKNKEEEEIKTKQLKILDKNKAKINLEEREKILRDLNINGIKLNKGSLWCIKELGMINNFLLCLVDSKKESECLKHTIIARNSGLDKNFYIIDLKDNNYFCCNNETERVYVFSKQLGITHTQFADIYDYLLDRLTIE